MTDYPAGRKSKKSSWQQAQAQKRWRDLIVISIVVLLGLVIINGIVKSLAFTREISRSSWISSQSLALAVNFEPPAVVVYQREPQNVTFYTIADDIYYATGDADDPVKKVNTLFDTPSGQNAANKLSAILGVNVEKFYFYDERKSLNGREDELFKDFASIKTPIALLIGKGTASTNTNLTQYELLKLWWQLKSMDVRHVEVEDLDDYSEEIIGRSGNTFRGIDRDKTNAQIGKAFRGFAERKHNIGIKNSSGNNSSAFLASEILGTYGWNVVESSADNLVATTVVYASKKDEEVEDLAKIFGCDIVVVQNQDENFVQLVLGEDFDKKYF